MGVANDKSDVPTTIPKLDNKLIEIITRNGHCCGEAIDPNEVILAQIKQAFADEGYVQSMGSQQLANATYLLSYGYMTGQSWYDRFMENISAYDLSDRIVEAARKASGLS